MTRPIEHSRAQHLQDLPSSERRRSRRLPVPEVIVAVEPADRAVPTCTAGADAPSGPAWAGSAIDISRDGLGLRLPFGLAPGAELLLTFRLDDDTTFARVPSAVVRTCPGLGLGAVRFRDWTPSEREALESFLGAA